MKYITPVFLKWCKSWKKSIYLTFALIVANPNKNTLKMYIFLTSPGFKLSNGVKMMIISSFYKKLIFFFFIFLHVAFNNFKNKWHAIEVLYTIFTTVPNLLKLKYSLRNGKQNTQKCAYLLWTDFSLVPNKDFIYP